MRTVLCTSILGALALTAGCTTVHSEDLSAGAGLPSAAGEQRASLPTTLDTSPVGATAAPPAPVFGAGANAPTTSPGASDVTATTAAWGGATAGVPTTAARSAASACVVKLGYVYSSDEGQTKVFIAPGKGAPDLANYQAKQQAMAQRLVDHISATGGIGPGCRVQLVYHDFLFFASDGFTGETQKECTDFGDDKHVFAVVNGTFEETSNLIPCLAGKNVVSFFSGSYFPTTTDFAKYRGYLYQPDFINPLRFGPFVQKLADVGYFGAHPKVGILLADDGSGNNQALVNDLWKPALQQMGINPVVFTYNTIRNNGPEAGRTSSQFQAAVLQFKMAGVDHVMFTPDPNVDVFFTPQAAAQNFRPRYAMTSNEMPEWGLVVASQEAGAVGISFQNFDTLNSPNPKAQQGTDPPSPARKACDQIYRDQPPAVQVAQYPLCDNLFLMQAALRGAKAVTPANLVTGMQKVGSSYSLAGAYGKALFAAPGRYDGASMVRVAQWNSATNSWDYITGPQPVP